MKNKQSHQHQGFTWFGFFTIKDEDYKYGVEALSNPKTLIHPNSTLSQITNNRELLFSIQVGGSKQIPNTQTKY